MKTITYAPTQTYGIMECRPSFEHRSYRLSDLPEDEMARVMDLQSTRPQERREIDDQLFDKGLVYFEACWDVEAKRWNESTSLTPGGVRCC